MKLAEFNYLYRDKSNPILILNGSYRMVAICTLSCLRNQVIAQGKRGSLKPTVGFYYNCDIFDLHHRQPFFLPVDSHLPETPMAKHQTHTSMLFEPSQCNGQCDRGQFHHAPEKRLHCYSHTRSDMYTVVWYSWLRVSGQLSGEDETFKNHPKLTKQCSW